MACRALARSRSPFLADPQTYASLKEGVVTSIHTQSSGSCLDSYTDHDTFIMGGVEGEVYVPAHFQPTAMVVQSTNHQQQYPTAMQPVMHSCHPQQCQAQLHQYPYHLPLQPQYQQHAPYPQQQYQIHPLDPYQPNQVQYQQHLQQHPTIVVQSTGAPHQPQPVLLVADPNMRYNVQSIYMHPSVMNTSLQTQMQQQQQQASGTSNPVKDTCIDTTTSATATTTNVNNITTGTSSATSNTNTTTNHNNASTANASSGSTPAAATSGTGTSKPSSGPFDCLDDIATHMNTINSHQTSLYSSFMKVKTSFLALTKGFRAIVSACSKS